MKFPDRFSCSKTKFHRNPSSGNRDAEDGRTDRGSWRS